MVVGDAKIRPISAPGGDEGRVRKRSYRRTLRITAQTPQGDQENTIRDTIPEASAVKMQKKANSTNDRCRKGIQRHTDKDSANKPQHEYHSAAVTTTGQTGHNSREESMADTTTDQDLPDEGELLHLAVT